MFIFGCSIFHQIVDICTASRQFFFLLIHIDLVNQICKLKQIRWKVVVCQVTALLNIGQRQYDTNIAIYGIFCIV